MFILDFILNLFMQIFSFMFSLPVLSFNNVYILCSLIQIFMCSNISWNSQACSNECVHTFFSPKKKNLYYIFYLMYFKMHYKRVRKKINK